MSSPLLEATQEFVKEIMAGDSTGHDWPHVERVLGMARQLAKSEDVDLEVVELAALLHDVPDWKLTDDVDERYARIVAFLSGREDLFDSQVDHVIDIIRTMSWHTGKTPASMEGKIVQDADRLDALGAIGIARCFAYGGKKGRPIYDPKDLTGDAFALQGEDYKNAVRSSVAHFYDKLFHIQDKMNTEGGRRMAVRRTMFLQTFLNQFFSEWNSLS